MKRLARKLWFLIAAAAFLVCGANHGAQAAGAGCFQDSIRAITLESWGWNGGYASQTADAALDYIKNIGSNTVVLLRPYEVNTATDHIDQDSSPNNKSGLPPDAVIIHGIQAAQARGLDVVLKLHLVEAKGYDVLANSKYAPQNPDTFFADYDQVVKDNAKLAQQYGVKILVLGTETGGELTARDTYKPYFEKLIADARSVFHGKITFATQISGHVARIVGSGDAFAMGQGACLDKERGHGNWCISGNEANYLSFWDKLDYIGIDLYPNYIADCSGAKNQLVCLQLGKQDNATPTRQDLVKGIYNDADGQNMVDMMRNIQQKNGGKPILITEIGASSIDGDQHCSGCWTDYKKPVNYQIQADMIGADAEVLCKEKQSGNLNIAGIFWDGIDSFPNSYAKKSSRGIDEQGFTFQNKPAGDVIKSYFTGATSP